MTTYSTTVLETNATRDAGTVSAPASFDWGLLCLRIWFGLSIFLKHGMEKILFFGSMATNFPDPFHIGRATTLAIALFSDAICSLLVVFGIATRWAGLVVFVNVFVAWTMGGHPDYFGHGIKPEHGEVMWLYLGANAALVIMGPGRFSLDRKLGSSEFARWVRLEPVFSPDDKTTPRPIVGKSVWTAIILGILAVGVWTVWMQRTSGASAAQNAPQFSQLAQDGSLVSLSQYEGKWVVLYFYSKDTASEDTIEAQNFQRDLPKYDELNAVVLGASPESIESNKTFSSKNSLTFTLLSANRQMIDDYGVPVSGSGDNQAMEHDTFLIAPNGAITTFWEVKDVHKHSGQVLDAIAAASKRLGR